MRECLQVLGALFGGATAFPPGLGVWRDDERGRLVYDNTVVVFSYVSEADLTSAAAREFFRFLMRLGREAKQGEVGILIDGEYRGFQHFDVGEQLDESED